MGRNPVGPNRLAGVDSVSDADTDFAFRLYHQLTTDSAESVFFSPYSISTALSMALAGARGNTAAEMRSVLGVEDEQEWHDARNRLELALVSSEGRHTPFEGNAVPLTMEPTNAIFGQANYAFRDEFLEVLAANYGAGMQTVDFRTQPEPARGAINDWVAQRTRDRIPELLPEDTITTDTRAVLVNAIYFLGNWVYQFDPVSTTAQPFHLLNRTTSEVQMMRGSPRTMYAAGQGWAAVNLPYWGSASMTLIVPDDGSFVEIEAALDLGFLAEVESRWEDSRVHLEMPRWETETQADLVELLSRLGINDVFDPTRADLSGMADFAITREPLFVSHVIHQANITVDEEGTEAAAATAVTVERVSGTQEVALKMDRPFIYLIRDDVTGEILFLGRYLGSEAT